MLLELELVKPTILCLTELALKSHEVNNYIIDNYERVNSFCRDGNRGGGVGIYCKANSSMRWANIPVDDLCIEKTFEATVARFKTKTSTFFVACIYRPPKKTKETVEIAMTQFRSLLSRIEERGGTTAKTVVMTDMNINLQKQSVFLESLKQVLAEFKLKIALNTPTRITHETASAIDHIYTNINDMEYKADVIQTKLSDHLATLLTVKQEMKPNTRYIVQRKFSAENNEFFSDLLRKIDWNKVYRHSNIEKAYEEFDKLIAASFNLAYPKAKTRETQKKRALTIPPEAIRLREEIGALTDIYISNKSAALKEKLAKKHQQYKNCLQTAKLAENKKIIEAAPNKMKAMWKVANQDRERKTHHMVKTTLKVDDTAITDPKQVVDTFNNFFVNKPITISNKAQSAITRENMNARRSAHKGENNPHSIFLMPTDSAEVQDTISEIKNTHSCGPDEISASLLKTNAEALTQPLAYLINLSFVEGKLPTELKLAKIKPVFKSKGEKTDINQYRPIALNSVFSKVFEKIFAKRLVAFLDKHSIISEHQLGFQKGKSTTDAIIKALEFITSNNEKKLTTIGAYLDLSAAFDCVKHELLLEKLEGYGIRGEALNWIASFLADRHQFVEMKAQNPNGKQLVEVYHSKVATNNIGIGQGSVIGPICYLLYVNSLLDNNSKKNKSDDYNRLLMFADDTTLLTSGSTAEEAALRCTKKLEDIRLEFAAHGLLLNENKTQLTVFPNNNTTLKLRLAGQSLAPTDSVKFLGMHVDNKLNWNRHISEMLKKINSGLFVVRRLSSISPPEVALQAYHSLVMSHINYGILAWGGTSVGNMETVLRLQKRGVRYLLKLGPRDSCRSHFKTLKIMTAPSLYIYRCILYILRQEVWERFEQNGDTHTYSTRQRGNLVRPAARLSRCERLDPAIQGFTSFKILPTELRAARNARNFPKLLKEHLIGKAFYAVSEASEQ